MAHLAFIDPFTAYGSTETIETARLVAIVMAPGFVIVFLVQFRQDIGAGWRWLRGRHK